jgi:putative ABC transport system substrate-binding protein
MNLGAAIRRRDFLVALGGAVAAWPLAAQAQRTAIPAIGLLAPGSKAEGKRYYDGLPLGMQRLGYLEGRDYVLESRYANGDLTRLPTLAEELVGLKPNVIVSGTLAAAIAARQATAAIPIVGVNLVDPVGNGLVKSEARPGTNITGTLQYLEGLTGKQLELARDLFPGATKIGVLANGNNIINRTLQKEAQAVAAKSGIRLTIVEVRTAAEVPTAFQTFARERTIVVSVLRDAMFMEMRQQIAAFALASRLPTIYGFREFVESGGLISYGIDIRASYIRAAFYVDRILKGEKPGDLPIEFPTKLELVINLKTAKALGMSIPPSLQQRADQVIE